MKITVVVRTCNRPEFLKEALASIHLQTHKDWEVLLFDDSESDENYLIYNWFKNLNKDKRIIYLTGKTNYEFFKDSWLISPDLALGEVIVRLDDDDLLTKDCLHFISDIYTNNPELDFTYGASVFFENDQLKDKIETKNPFEHTKTLDEWAPYTITNNKPWKEPWRFIKNYYKEPQSYTSIIHAAKANQLSIFHLYTLRVSSVKVVKDKITMTSQFVDDLEFLGSLDYLGLGHNSIKKILCFVRLHNQGKITDYNRNTDGQTMYQENLRIRDKVDELRPSGFLSKIIPIQSKQNIQSSEPGILLQFQSMKNAIQNFLNTY